ncbi:hypothetical protein EN875_032020 [Mesorhizobium sp. M2D.F.Ca.ET.232.01.1.1]|uniref:hypothetical protein n=1 Tax=Mesorhizobium sp. M2D.F.Ca.ET.232.01.1.1 TaxID=2496670 RepID=UPI000FCC2623|nr:hypothetical protein [Mesorhizobium sp. M2D.F.Ca.ET.232.01.1.1]TGP28187.1 hypothetical protein EN875_032020 [Mesorhizobium sp. M2D.F.Ca.ET.232.01.1.1]
MNATVAITLLQTILTLIPQITSSKAVNTVITALIQIIPIAVQEAQDLLGPIRNIIATLSANDKTTADQLAALKALDAQVDAAFDDAVTAYLAKRGPAPANPQ